MALGCFEGARCGERQFQGGAAAGLAAAATMLSDLIGQRFDGSGANLLVATWLRCEPDCLRCSSAPTSVRAFGNSNVDGVESIQLQLQQLIAALLRFHRDGGISALFRFFPNASLVWLAKMTEMI